jgi:FkbM family methyltransferase
MVKIEQNKVMVQIGTNNGADEFNTVVKSSNPSKVILVEPNMKLNGEILKNYSGISNVFIENVAITEEDKGLVKLVIPKNHYDRSGKRIGKTNYIDKHYSLLPMDDWGSDFNEIEVRSMTFAGLCEKHGITEIGYLQIDTEGYDAEIIKSIDFSKIHIDVIKYEDWSFPVSCFTRHGDKAAKYGVNGMNEVAFMLKFLGYVISKESSDFLAVKE